MVSKTIGSHGTDEAYLQGSNADTDTAGEGEGGMS